MYDPAEVFRLTRDREGRPWWARGDGELLPVIYGGDGEDDDGSFLDALDQAGAAAEKRIQADDGGGDPPAGSGGDGGGGGDGGAPPPEPPAPPTDPETGEPVPFEEHRKLRNENAEYRKKWQPFEQAFGAFDDEARAALLEAAPGLGADLAQLARVAGSMHSSDRQWLANVIALSATDPEQAATLLGEAANVLRGQAGPGTPPAPAGEDDDDPEGYVSRADLERMFAERDQRAQEAAQERAIEERRGQIMREARDLGYDPDSSEPFERMRVAALFDAAARDDGEPEGALARAHELVQSWEESIGQKVIDGKRAEAQRPKAPPGGASPSGSRTLESMDDAAAAMDARLDSAGIPKRQRR